MDTILFPCDFSELAAKAFDIAYTLANSYKAKLILLHVHPTQEVVEGEFGMPPPEPEESDETRLQKLLQLIPDDSDIEHEGLVVHGVPGEEILKAAKDKKADLIVLGTHGRRGISRLLIGSVADMVAREAPCPVISYRSSHTED